MVIGTEGRGSEFLYVRMREKNSLVPEKVIGTAKGSYSANAPYLTARPQYVRIGRCVSGTLECSTGAPQGTVWAPFLSTLYTLDFRYNSESCHIQKYSDDTAVVACVRSGQEKE